MTSPPKKIHPYLAGNFAPVFGEYVQHPCDIVAGSIPKELKGGQYIRNGGNPVHPPEAGRDYHWFDGDGMLHGVLFPNDGQPPKYTNRHLATPVLSLSLLLSRAPIPSISLLISPLSSLHKIVIAILHAFLVVLEAGVGTLSVANTNVIWWSSDLGSEASEEGEVKAIQDGRLLALCESGPPLEVRVPELQTVDWDRLEDMETKLSLRGRRKGLGWKRWGLGRIQDDWMTAHPRVDPVNGDLIFYQCQMFEKPYVRYSVIDRHGRYQVWKKGIDVGRAKMMHDFGCSRSTTVILNLPLTLSPLNLLSISPQPLIHFDRTLPSDFILLPRDASSPQITFRDPEPSMIFHTANVWDVTTPQGEAVDMVACRFNSAKLVYAAGAVPIPLHEASMGKDDVVRLHYYRFLHGNDGSHRISHSFPLSCMPFEFPNVHPEKAMASAQYVYGCTMREGGFDERLGGAAKVDCLVKVDVRRLSQIGRQRGEGKGGPVSERSVMELLQGHKNGELEGPIQVFSLPEGWYAQEGRFVPRQGKGLAEDDGYIITYVFDESYLEADGSASNAPGTGSELWIIDARLMAQGTAALVCRIKLPQRVPYGLHGTFVPSSHSSRQRDLKSPLSPQASLLEKIYSSRLAHVFDVIFTRPASRDKSRAEKIAFAFMFPLSWVMLFLSIKELVGHHYSAKGIDLTSISKHATGYFPWPQTVTAFLLLLTLTFMLSR